jgi:hypothetical protein
MSEAKHMTGWRLHGKGFRPDTQNGGEFVPIIDERGRWIADVRTAAGGGEDYRTWAELIAAAPDLLESCSNLLDSYSDLCRQCGYQPENFGVVQAATDAIAKARGSS